MDFRDLKRWDVTFFRGLSWQWPERSIFPLGEVIVRKQAEVGYVADIASVPIIEKISFGGVISITDVEKRKGYKGRLFWADPTDLIYSKIRAKQGSLAVVLADTGRVAVSAEYPVYAVDTEKVKPPYLEIVLRSKSFLRLLDGLAHGGSSKTRVPPEDFERLKIPVPSLDVQVAIVTYWQQVEKEREAAKASYRKVVSDLDERLRAVYRAPHQQDVITHRWLTVRWGDVARWDIKTARASAFRASNLASVPLGEFAEEATELVRPWEQPEKNWPVYGVNNKEGVFFSHYQRGEDFNAPYKRIRQDWFFHNPTRSSVGSLGIVPEVPEDALTSPEYQVWRIKKGLVPGYAAVLINTPFFVNLIQFHRVGAVKQRLYVENLLQIPIPVLPEDEQYQIAMARETAILRAKEAQQACVVAKDEVEAMILGTMPVPRQ